MKKATLVILLLLLAFFTFSCKKNSADSTSLYCGDDIIISHKENGFTIFGGSATQRLKLENTDFDELEITLYSENGKSATLSAKKGQTAQSRAIGGNLAAVSITAEGNEQSFALTKNGLDALLSSDVCNITIIDNINIEGNLQINRPVSLFARSFLCISNDIYYITDSEGELNLSGNISAARLAASAPGSHLWMPENLVPEKTNLYICAKSLNGEEMLPNERIVTSLEELAEIATIPPYFNAKKEAIVASGIDFKNSFTIDFPCKLEIKKNCKNTDKLSVATDKKGEIELLGDFNYRKIKISAPDCNIKWENSCRLDLASQSFNAASLNGHNLKNYALGGNGKNKITGAVMKGNDALSSGNIVWEVKNNTLSATVSGVTAPSALKNAKLDFESDGGRITIDAVSKGDNGGIDLLSRLGTYVTVTDKNGGTRKYLIKTEIKTKLPVVVIETEGGVPIEDKENYVNAKIALEGDFSEGFSSMAETEVKIRGRGNSTWNWFDKKPYKLKFKSNVSLLGLCEGKEWVLLANYADNSLIRNYVALESAKVLDNMDCYATQYPVDVFLNGEYIGVYSLGEQIEVADSRAQLISNAKSVDTGFFFEIGGTYIEDGESSFSTAFMKCIEILEPEGSSFTEKQKTYIKNYFKLADETIRKANGYEDFIDIESLIDWLIMTEISFNSDGAMRRSVYMKKDHGGKIKMGPVWDFDIAYGNSETDFENYNAWCCLATEYNYVDYNWICTLMEDEDFVEMLRVRWNQVKVKLYTTSIEAVEKGSSLVAPSAVCNFERWNTLGQKVTLQPDFMTEYDTYEKQIAYLKAFINNRFRWIDEQLNANEENQEKGV